MLVWLGENINMEEKIVQIINKMADYLNVSQMKKLQEVLLQSENIWLIIRKSITAARLRWIISDEIFPAFSLGWRKKIIF